MTEIRIIDIIDHKNKYGNQQFAVLNRSPEFVYDRKSGCLIAEDSGFFNFYIYNNPSGAFYAFAGRKFDIPLKDGSVEKAYGQWWDGIPADYQGLVDRCAYGTPEGLSRCNVFCGVYIDPDIIENWLSKNETTNNYSKYDKRHKDFGEQKIVSRWETDEAKFPTL